MLRRATYHQALREALERNPVVMLAGARRLLGARYGWQAQRHQETLSALSHDEPLVPLRRGHAVGLNLAGSAGVYPVHQRGWRIQVQYAPISSG